MQELEKILEEINENTISLFSGVNMISAKKVEKILRKHMNDGWVPVEDRLPDNSEDVLVTTDVGLITFGCLLNGEWITNQEPDYPIAWRTLPEPYRPERSENDQ